MKILLNLRFLARQGLALRGSYGDDTESNFCQLFCLQVEDKQALEAWINKKTDNYYVTGPAKIDYVSANYTKLYFC